MRIFKITKVLCIILILIPLVSMAQTGLYTYDGGYFIRDGQNWTEYRPSDKDGIWAVYTQYNEEDNFYNIQSTACSVSIPKSTVNNFYIYRNNKWEVVYQTKDIYNYFNDSGRQIYCYNGGYFVRDGDKWREYRPNDKVGVWAEYTQYNEEDYYYNIQSTACSVSVPKAVSNNFYINNNGKWEVVYYTTSIYDATAGYDFSFTYDYYRISDAEGILQDVKSPARLSFNRKGEGVIVYGDNTKKFTFKEIAQTTIKGTDLVVGFSISLSDDQVIHVLDGWSMVSCEPTIPFMDLMDMNNKQDVEKIQEMILTQTFFR